MTKTATSLVLLALPALALSQDVIRHKLPNGEGTRNHIRRHYPRIHRLRRVRQRIGI